VGAGERERLGLPLGLGVALEEGLPRELPLGLRVAEALREAEGEVRAEMEMVPSMVVEGEPLGLLLLLLQALREGETRGDCEAEALRVPTALAGKVLLVEGVRGGVGVEEKVRVALEEREAPPPLPPPPSPLGDTLGLRLAVRVVVRLALGEAEPPVGEKVWEALCVGVAVSVPKAPADRPPLLLLLLLPLPSELFPSATITMPVVAVARRRGVGERAGVREPLVLAVEELLARRV
jgi:hypothetical protein